jgi:hypothetical protein
MREVLSEGEVWQASCQATRTPFQGRSWLGSHVTAMEVWLGHAGVKAASPNYASAAYKSL